MTEKLKIYLTGDKVKLFFDPKSILNKKKVVVEVMPQGEKLDIEVNNDTQGKDKILSYTINLKLNKIVFFRGIENFLKEKMISFMDKEKIIRLLSFIPFIYLRRKINGYGRKRKCYICQKTFDHFEKYRGGVRNLPKFIKLLDVSGFEGDYCSCIHCNSFGRERHLFMFFDQLNLWKEIKNKRILHIAPEINLSKKITDQQPIFYIKGDIEPGHNKNITKIDITKIQFSDNSFDFVICNHVLEHVPQSALALSEIYRVLKPNGLAILQVPLSKLLEEHFENGNINTDRLRYFFYGQEDHVRLLSEEQYLADLKKTGFILKIKKHHDYFDEKTTVYYGVSDKEDLILVYKPASQT